MLCSNMDWADPVSLTIRIGFASEKSSDNDTKPFWMKGSSISIMQSEFEVASPVSHGIIAAECESETSCMGTIWPLGLAVEHHVLMADFLSGKSIQISDDHAFYNSCRMEFHC